MAVICEFCNLPMRKEGNGFLCVKCGYWIANIDHLIRDENKKVVEKLLKVGDK